MRKVYMMENDYAREDALDNVFEYCNRKYQYLGGKGLDDASPEIAKNFMKLTKDHFRKSNRSQLCHMNVFVENIFGLDTDEFYTQPFLRGSHINVLAETIAETICEQGFQNCCYVELRADIVSEYINLHYIINTVNFVNGSRMENHTLVEDAVLNMLMKKYPGINWLE